MNILNTVEREAFNSPPVFSSFQRKQYFDFPSKLRRFAAGLRNPAYQLGFLLSAGFQSREEVLLTRLFPPAGYRVCGAPARARSANGRLRPISSSRPPTSPALNRRTSSPIAATTPVQSCPSTIGSSASIRPPRILQSIGLIDPALICTSTSSDFGGRIGKSTSSNFSGEPSSRRMIAFMSVRANLCQRFFQVHLKIVNVINAE
jgi:hypothetical protein